jgi:hypothetical protein
MQLAVRAWGEAECQEAHRPAAIGLYSVCCDCYFAVSS